MSEWPSVAQLIPHRDPMILLDEMLDWSKGRSRCGLEVRHGARFVDEGKLPAPFLIEHMAQSVAVCLGYEAFRGGRGVHVGMIVSCRSFEALVGEAHVGDRLLVSAEQKRANASVSSFDCRVNRLEDAARAGEGLEHSEGDCLARATLTLYHGELGEAR